MHCNGLAMIPYQGYDDEKLEEVKSMSKIIFTFMYEKSISFSSRSTLEIYGFYLSKNISPVTQLQLHPSACTWLHTKRGKISRKSSIGKVQNANIVL